MSNTRLKQFWSSLALYHCRGLGAQKWKKLLDFYGDAQTAVQNVKNWLKDGLAHPAIFESFQKKEWYDKAIEEFEQAQKLGAGILLYSDFEYPGQLKEIPNPPLFLYYQGDLGLLKRPCLAIVGSRTCSKYGLDTAGDISYKLSSAGITVVSGFALGIDSRAHNKSMQAIGSSVAVLGTGLDVHYPYRNNYLRRSMQNQGLLLTEFSPGTHPDPRNFPRRNRIISGLSLGVLVVEAGPKSGSLITARCALEQNRDVFAVPGPLNLQSYQGCNALIKQGALLVSSAEDILEELAPLLSELNPGSGENSPSTGNSSQEIENASEKDKYSDLNNEEQKVADIVSQEEKIHIDTLTRKLDWDSGKASQILLMLEMKGIVKQLPGMYYCLI